MTLGRYDVRGSDKAGSNYAHTLWTHAVCLTIFVHSSTNREGRLRHVSKRTRVFEQVNLSVFVCTACLQVCVSPATSVPIGHGLYLARRSPPNSMGDASERREPGSRSALWLRCAVSKISRTQPVGTLAQEKEGGRGPENPESEQFKHICNLLCHTTIPQVDQSPWNGWLISK